MTRGVVLYRGPSLIDGGPIVVVASLRSNNAKTGDCAQTWILREDMPPVQAAKSGADRSICGDCPLRGRVVDGRNVGRACYVVLHQAPSSVWLAYRRGVYREVSRGRLRRLLSGAFVRIGAYGDPAACLSMCGGRCSPMPAGGRPTRINGGPSSCRRSRWPRARPTPMHARRKPWATEYSASWPPGRRGCPGTCRAPRRTSRADGSRAWSAARATAGHRAYRCLTYKSRLTGTADATRCRFWPARKGVTHAPHEPTPRRRSWTRSPRGSPTLARGRRSTTPPGRSWPPWSRRSAPRATA